MNKYSKASIVNHLLTSIDMVQKESNAQTLVMHSNRITFMPDKVTVHYRNGRNHVSGLSDSLHLVVYMQHSINMDLMFESLCNVFLMT